MATPAKTPTKRRTLEAMSKFKRKAEQVHLSWSDGTGFFASMLHVPIYLIELRSRAMPAQSLSAVWPIVGPLGSRTYLLPF